MNIVWRQCMVSHKFCILELYKPLHEVIFLLLDAELFWIAKPLFLCHILLVVKYNSCMSSSLSKVSRWLKKKKKKSKEKLEYFSRMHCIQCIFRIHIPLICISVALCQLCPSTVCILLCSLSYCHCWFKKS